MPSAQITVHANPILSQKHVPALDGIRGLAISLVLIHHLLRANGHTGIRLFDLLYVFVESAWVGVDLFFVLSGFLITGILYDSLSSDHRFKRFYMRRILRIFPLYYGVLFLLLVLTAPLHLVWRGMQWKLLFYLQNMIFMVYSPAPFINLNHFWSLAVEEQFYLVWPFLVFWIKGLKRLILATVVLSLSAILIRFFLISKGFSPGYIYEFTPCRADTLLLGGCLALLMRSEWRNQVIDSAMILFSSAVILLFAIALHQHNLNWQSGYVIETVGYTVIAMVGVGLIASSFRKACLLKTMFELPALRFLGKYSYGIYIFHYSLDASLTNFLRFWLLRFSHSRFVSTLGAASLITCLTILLAMMSFHFYEKRFLNLKRYFE